MRSGCLAACAASRWRRFRLRQVAAIGMAPRHHLAGDLGMAVGAGELEHGVAVPVQAQPAHAVQDRVDRGLGRAGAIGILNAQQELAAFRPREQPVEQRGARAADVKESGRREGAKRVTTRSWSIRWRYHVLRSTAHTPSIRFDGPVSPPQPLASSASASPNAAPFWAGTMGRGRAEPDPVMDAGDAGGGDRGVVRAARLELGGGVMLAGRGVGLGAATLSDGGRVMRAIGLGGVAGGLAGVLLAWAARRVGPGTGSGTAGDGGHGRRGGDGGALAARQIVPADAATGSGAGGRGGGF